MRDDSGNTARTGGRMPRGAKPEYAYRSGYDGKGQVYVTHVFDQGCSALLTQPEPNAA